MYKQIFVNTLVYIEKFSLEFVCQKAGFKLKYLARPGERKSVDVKYGKMSKLSNIDYVQI